MCEHEIPKPLSIGLQDSAAASKGSSVGAIFSATTTAGSLASVCEPFILCDLVQIEAFYSFVTFQLQGCFSH